MLLADECEGHRYPLKLPTVGDKMEWKPVHTTRCGQSALMELPYDPTLPIRIVDEEHVFIIDHDGEPPEFEEEKNNAFAPTKQVPVEHMVTVCAVDDAVGLWPRYAGVVSDRSFQRP